MIRLRRLVVVLAVALAAVVTVAPVDLPLAPAAEPAGAVKAIGSEPLDDILAAADQKRTCGTSRDLLAALMIAPIYPEAGGTATIAPSPMTLSRWDTQAALWAFGSPTTDYQRAFWHPGIGLWQFDSAGGWNLTAADAINTQTAALQAAATMGQRWCSASALPDAQRRASVWSLWYGCDNGVCEQIYNEIFDGTSLRTDALTRLSTVSRLGGMEQRQCLLNGVAVACSYVDPSRAQGNTSWAVSSPNIPTPIAAPFYVISQGGREHRVWLTQDTGYGTTVSADKLITANARTGLTWSTATTLCDQTAGRGACGPGARVADTAWGPRSEDPFGSFDGVTVGGGAVTVTGWAIDPDTNDPISVHVYIDGTYRGAVVADGSRRDLEPVVPGYGDRHGFATTISGISGGTHEVCAFALNTGPFGDEDPRLGCATAVVSGTPFGSLDSVTPVGADVRVRGWAIDPDTSSPLVIHVYVDDVFAASGPADRARSDVEDAHGGWGAAHGYELDIDPEPGERTVCAWALNQGLGDNALVGCRTLVVPDVSVPTSPQGVGAVGGSAQAEVSWAAPTSDGNTPITGYTVTASPGGAVVRTAPGVRRVEVIGLQAGIDHTFAVVAENLIGPSPAVTTAAVTVGPATTSFADVSANHPFFDQITWFGGRGITTGFPDGTFSPSTSVSRQAMAAFLYRLEGQPLGPDPRCGVAPFTDVSVGSEFCGEIAWLVDRGITTGFSDGSFHPDDVVARQAMAAFLYRLAEAPLGPDPRCGVAPFTDVSVGSEFCGEIAWLVDRGITTGFSDGSFHPDDVVARQAMAAFLYRLTLVHPLPPGPA